MVRANPTVGAVPVLVSSKGLPARNGDSCVSHSTRGCVSSVALARNAVRSAGCVRGPTRLRVPSFARTHRPLAFLMQPVGPCTPAVQLSKEQPLPGVRPVVWARDPRPLAIKQRASDAPNPRFALSAHKPGCRLSRCQNNSDVIGRSAKIAVRHCARTADR